MDHENELARAKWLMLAAAIFLVSGCLSWDELIYLISGRETQADVTKAFEVTKRGRLGMSEQRRLTVEYSFADTDGKRRIGTDTVSPDWPLPGGGKVAIQYTAGADGSSRLAGHVHWVGLTLFALSLGAMGIFGFRLWREASEATRDQKPRRKK
jgi:hypothetical protein